MRLIRVSAMLAIGLSAPAIAQQAATAAPRSAEAPGPFVVKTVPLHHLTTQQAVKLLLPYSQTPGGGVYEAPTSISAVTIREVPKILAEMTAVLAEYDREPATVTLSFQLVAAENTNVRDPSVANLDSLLRGVLKFSGYRLLSASVANASENGRVAQTLSGDGDPFSLTVFVTDLRVDGNNASVHLDVDLWRPLIASKGQQPGRILSTGVTVPIGQTVVLGTTAVEGGQGALILTVRPQLAKR